MPSGILLTENSLQIGLKKYPSNLQAKVGAVMEYSADRAQNYMRVNAPWTDQSGNARQGLFAKAGKSVKSWWIDLYHTVPYGIWLEIAHGKRYAIIAPTVKKQGVETMAMIRKLLGS